MATPETVVKAFALLAANWPKEEVTPEQVNLYTKMLGDIPDELLEAATLDIIATATWFPKVAELRSAAYKLMVLERGLPSGGEAWGEIFYQIQHKGEHQAPTYSHPLIKAAVMALGGYLLLCRSEDAMADRAHFLKVYDELARREAQGVMMLPQVREVAKRLPAEHRPQLEAGK